MSHVERAINRTCQKIAEHGGGDPQITKEYIRRVASGSGPFSRHLTGFLSRRFRKSGLSRDGLGLEMSERDPEVNLIRVGVQMETNNELLRELTEEVARSSETLRKLADEVIAMGHVVGPELHRQVTELRDSRMAVVREVRESLTALRDLRAFFLESTYETEIGRLERLVALCRELEQVRATGVFDAVCDAALRLAAPAQKAPDSER